MVLPGSSPDLSTGIKTLGTGKHKDSGTRTGRLVTAKGNKLFIAMIFLSVEKRSVSSETPYDKTLSRLLEQSLNSLGSYLTFFTSRKKTTTIRGQTYQ